MRVQDLVRLQPGEMPRKDIIADLLKTHGKPGKDGWSLTEVLKLPRFERAKILDLLTGLGRGPVGLRRGAPYPGRFKIKTVDGQPFTITKVRPDPDVTPAIVTDPDHPEQAHYHPQQWVPQDFELAPEEDLPIADEHENWRGALWLLNQYGWEARMGGSTKRRWRRRAPRGKGGEGDRWAVVEDAFLKRHPDKCKELQVK